MVGVTGGPESRRDGDEVRIDTLVRRVADTLLARGQMLCAAESCTGGGIAAALTEIPGSSRWFERGFVTYSNEAKVELLGVLPTTLAAHGAVSEAVVREMASGALAHSHACWALSVSGIAGPDGGTPDKPVGTVCFGWAGPDARVRAETLVFPGDRSAVRRAAIRHALEGLLIFCSTV
jgi:nicotinamide-nucleotide amidase